MQCYGNPKQMDGERKATGSIVTRICRSLPTHVRCLQKGGIFSFTLLSGCIPVQRNNGGREMYREREVWFFFTEERGGEGGGGDGSVRSADYDGGAWIMEHIPLSLSLSS